jgi:hypothetical protein
MHCSTEIPPDSVVDGTPGDSHRSRVTADVSTGDEAGDRAERLIAVDSRLDNALTLVVGVVGGLVVGVGSTVVLLILTSSTWGVGLGVLAWLAVTAYLVRQPTVLQAVSKASFGVAIVLLLVPLVAFAPSSGETRGMTRVILFVSMLGAVVIPAGITAGAGVALQRLEPESP